MKSSLGTNLLPFQRYVKPFRQKSFGDLAEAGLADSIGDRLAQCRRLLSYVREEDLSQDDVAQMAGLAKGSMSQWENGHKNPSEATLEAIALVMQRHGLPLITVPWLRYNVGEPLPRIGEVPPDHPRKSIKLPTRAVPHPNTKRVTAKKRRRG